MKSWLFVHRGAQALCRSNCRLPPSRIRHVAFVSGLALISIGVASRAAAQQSVHPYASAELATEWRDPDGSGALVVAVPAFSVGVSTKWHIALEASISLPPPQDFQWRYGYSDFVGDFQSSVKHTLILSYVRFAP